MKINKDQLNKLSGTENETINLFDYGKLSWTEQYPNLHCNTSGASQSATSTELKEYSLQIRLKTQDC